MRIKKKALEEIKEEIKEEVQEEPKFYVFGADDTLEKVAEKFDTTVEKLKELNGNVEISASNQMRVR